MWHTHYPSFFQWLLPMWKPWQRPVGTSLWHVAFILCEVWGRVQVLLWEKMEPRPQEPQTFQTGAGCRQPHSDFLYDCCQTTSECEVREKPETPIDTPTTRCLCTYEIQDLQYINNLQQVFKQRCEQKWKIAGLTWSPACHLHHFVPHDESPSDKHNLIGCKTERTACCSTSHTWNKFLRCLLMHFVHLEIPTKG